MLSCSRTEMSVRTYRSRLLSHREVFLPSQEYLRGLGSNLKSFWQNRYFISRPLPLIFLASPEPYTTRKRITQISTPPLKVHDPRFMTPCANHGSSDHRPRTAIKVPFSQSAQGSPCQHGSPCASSAIHQLVSQPHHSPLSHSRHSHPPPSFVRRALREFLVPDKMQQV